MSITYRTYLDGSLTDGFQLYNYNSFFALIDYIITGADGPGSAISDTLTGNGVGFCQNPNAIPDVAAAYAPLYGVDAAEGNSNSILPWIGVPWDFGLIEVRLFFKTLAVRPRWKVGGTTVNLSDRWVGGGYYAWTGYGYGSRVARNRQEWSHGSTAQQRDYTLTDSSGIATYIAFFGAALYNGSTWSLYSPASELGGTPIGRGDADLSFVLRKNELARTSLFYDAFNPGLAGVVYPTMEPYQSVHMIRQRNPGSLSDAGYNLSVDYGAKWSAATGLLDLSGVASLVDYDYEQAGRVSVYDASGNPVSGATVAFGAGTYTGTTNASGLATIPSIPRGSWVKDVEGLAAGNVTSLPLADASDYPASVGASDSEKPALKPQRTPSLPDDPDGGEFEATYAAKVSDTLTGVKGPDGIGAYGVKKADLYGGEAATLPYIDFEITVASLPVAIAGTPRLYVREEIGGDVSITTGTADDGTIDPDGLDCTQDPFKEPFFFESREPTTKEHIGIDMEATFFQKDALTELLKCPSECILPDGERLLAAVQGGAVKLWRTRDLWATSEGPTTLSNAHAFREVILREGPDGAINAHLTDNAGQVYLALSPDGGDTWTDAAGTAGLLTTLSDLPACRFERGDLRFDGNSQWLRLHPWSGSTGSPGVNLYISKDGGVTWEFDGIMDAQAKWPWLMVDPLDGSLLALYHNGSHIACKPATTNAFLWTWGDEVEIAATGVTGPVGFINGQKAVCAFREGKDTVKFYKSLDGGLTWAEGSEG